MNKNLLIYCVTNKDLKFLRNLEYKLAGVGKNEFSNEYINSNNLDNIFYKEEFYSELTFHYWFWKNELKNFNNKDETWIGFCQKRRFWLQNEKILEMDPNNISNYFLKETPIEWNNFDAIICKPISVDVRKISKMIKRGWRNLIKDPSIFFNKKKQTIKLHFDMHHGYGLLDKAIERMKEKDRFKFRNFVNISNSFNPHIMLISKPKILNLWFKDLFEWLFECEKVFKFEDLKNYETKRLFAYLAERYLSYWVTEYTTYKEWPYVFYDSEKNFIKIKN